jgi:contractile injection system tube protein
MTLPICRGRRLAVTTVILLAAGAASASAAPPVKLTVKAVEGSGVTFTSQFSPTSFLVEKAVPWKTLPGDQEPPTQQFESPQPSLLTAQLMFDSDAPGSDVNDFVAPLEHLASIDPVLNRPPVVKLQFGAFSFTGVIESVSVKYSQFEADGTKDRAVVKFVIRGASGAVVVPR